MRKHFWPVIEADLRPAQKGRCRHCGEKLGAEHRPQCKIRRRTVVVEVDAAFEVIVWQPEDWTLEMIAAHYLGAGLTPFLSCLEKQDGRVGKMVTNVREATLLDEEHLPEYSP